MFKGRTSSDFVVRYWVVYYDANWNELPKMILSCVTWREVAEALAAWDRANVNFLRSGEAVACGTAEAQYLSVEMGYVEI